MTRLKNAKAFTLIELIVVIVIIGILVAIAAVAYNSIIANSKKSALEASASQVAKIIQAESASSQLLATDKTTPAATEFDDPRPPCRPSSPPTASRSPWPTPRLGTAGRASPRPARPRPRSSST